MIDNIEALRAWIGRRATADDLLSKRLVESYCATLSPHLAPTGHNEAPLALHWCLAPPLASMEELGDDGHPARGGFMPPVSLPRRMWAGGEVETLIPLRVGEAVTRHSTIRDVSVKEGRSGVLCFVSVAHEFVGARGVAIRDRQDIVYRSGDTGTPAPGSIGEAGKREPRRHPELVREVEASPVLLFRYSALTFNGHRIHYDLDYAVTKEGYPGLVVHGPLQASLLFNAAASLLGRTPPRFTYRAVEPLIAGRPFSVCAVHAENGSATCWTESGAGKICMKATAS